MVFDNNKLYFWKFCIIACLVWYLVLKKNLKLSFYSNIVKKNLLILYVPWQTMQSKYTLEMYIWNVTHDESTCIYVTCKAWHNTTSVLNHTLKIRSLL